MTRNNEAPRFASLLEANPSLFRSHPERFRMTPELGGKSSGMVPDDLRSALRLIKFKGMAFSTMKPAALARPVPGPFRNVPEQQKHKAA